jgi:hypothetical protein
MFHTDESVSRSFVASVAIVSLALVEVSPSALDLAAFECEWMSTRKLHS